MREEGRGKVKLWLMLAAVAVGALIAVFLLTRQDAASTADVMSRRAGEETKSRPTDERTATVDATSRRVEDGQGESILTRQDAASAEEEPEFDAPQTEEEKREAEETKLVDAFDGLTDKWQKPSKSGVTMADVDNFAKAFRKIPKARRDECIHRALNLIPDENVMLLAGVLMDKTMDKEIVETVYSDILNRDEDVKKPILQQIFKDKTHPCWADTAWILDVTGELPKAK